MISRTASRIAVAAASALIAGGAMAIPATAQAVTVAPGQYFYGQVFSMVSSSTHQGVIDVGCVGPATTGHPLPGQVVDVEQVFPPVTTTLGFTGKFGTEIDATLTWSWGTITVVTPIATLTEYGVTAPIPTSITVPCGGSGVMSFAPAPDPDNSGVSSNVGVTFESTGV